MRTRILKTAFVVLAVFGLTQSFALIKNSKHDLSYASNTIKENSATDNAEICVYCHTPHGSNTGFEGAPLWNKETSAATYTTYSNPAAQSGDTLAGTTITGVSNPSKACLSCHDGVSAINSVVNAPGSGAGTDYLGMTDGTTTTTDGSTAGDKFVMPAGRITNLGTSLVNDHPVSVDYTEGKASLRATTYTFPDTWTTASGGNTVADVLRAGKVECASCHDPHLGENQLFLRAGNNTGSKVCLGCHDK